MSLKAKFGRLSVKNKNGRVPWHVTLFALCIWGLLASSWFVACISGISGIAYLFWPRIRSTLKFGPRGDKMTHESAVTDGDKT